MPADRRRLGIRARVVASFLVLLVTAEVVSIAVLAQVGTNRLTEQADRDLFAAADDLRVRLEHVDATIGQPGGPALTSVFDDFLRARPARGDQAYLAFVGGRPFASSAGSPTALDRLSVASEWATVRTTQTGETTTSAGPIRWLAVPVMAGDRLLGVFVASEFLAGQQDVLRGTIVTVSLVTFLVLVGACLLAWGAAGRALAPVRELAAAARSVSSGDDLDARIDVSSRDEVGELAASFNGMLNRLQVAFDSQKRFLDDAAHELRTPITVVRGHVELLDDDPERRAGEIELVLDEMDRMDRLVTDLRVLARSRRPDFLTTERIDVATLISEVGRKAESLASRRWSMRCDTTGSVLADRQRLTQAVLNLVDNAVSVTGAEDRIEVAASAREDRLVLTVRDSGPGIAPGDLPTLFDRSGRTIRRRPGGTGLGLPIVAAIVQAHGGSVTVSSELGIGTCFEIVLPQLDIRDLEPTDNTRFESARRQSTPAPRARMRPSAPTDRVHPTTTDVGRANDPTRRERPEHGVNA